MKRTFTKLLFGVITFGVAGNAEIFGQARQRSDTLPTAEMLPSEQSVQTNQQIEVPLRDRRVVLHVYLPSRIKQKPALVLFSSGSGGWHRFDEYVATALAERGFAVCGISTHTYLTTFYSTSRPATADQVVSDYMSIINESKQILGMESTRPVILAGWSLGAGYAPMIASQPSIKQSVYGVISIAIEKKNEAALSVGNRLLSRLTGRTFGPSFDVTKYLPQLSPIPVAMIQSTQDPRASAKGATALISSSGEVSPTLRVFEVTSARGHSFAGGRVEFTRTLDDVLSWFRSTRGGQF